jgi:hypothetical protein
MAVSSGLLAVTPTTHGGAIPYSDVTAPDVMFVTIIEANGNPGDAAIPLFGPPYVPPSGNSLDFDPIGFRAQAADGDSFLIDGQLNFTVMAKGDFPIRKLVFEESGEFEVLGTALANVHLSVDRVEVVGVYDGGSVKTPRSAIKAGPFVFSLTRRNEDNQGPWSGGLTVDLDEVLADHGVAGHVAKVKIALNNRMTAAALRGAAGYIDKKDFTVTVVPEPGGIVLLAIGLAGLVLAAARRPRRTADLQLGQELTAGGPSGLNLDL